MFYKKNVWMFPKLEFVKTDTYKIVNYLLNTGSQSFQLIESKIFLNFYKIYLSNG